MKEFRDHIDKAGATNILSKLLPFKQRRKTSVKRNTESIVEIIDKFIDKSDKDDDASIDYNKECKLTLLLLNLPYLNLNSVESN